MQTVKRRRRNKVKPFYTFTRARVSVFIFKWFIFTSKVDTLAITYIQVYYCFLSADSNSRIPPVLCVIHCQEVGKKQQLKRKSILFLCQLTYFKWTHKNSENWLQGHPLRPTRPSIQGICNPVTVNASFIFTRKHTHTYTHTSSVAHISPERKIFCKNYANVLMGGTCLLYTSRCV